MSLFISIASYSDPVLGFTLKRLLETARWPEALHVGLVEQSPGDWPRPEKDALAPARLSYVRIDPVDARGPCWARAIAMSLYDGEDWFLQIDSHMDFEPHWDQRLMEEAQALLPGRRGVVLTGYPSPFVLRNEQAVRLRTSDQVLAHVVKPGSVFAADNLALMFETRVVDTDTPLPGFHVAAGCLFAPGAFAEEFPYDPHLYFHGEEQSLALRLFTHGWDIFHVPALPLYHLYKTADAGAPLRPLHWDQSQDAPRRCSWWTLEQRSRARLHALVAGAPLGVYGLGTVRTVADFARLSGIDYAARTLAPQAFAPLAAATAVRLLRPSPPLSFFRDVAS